MILSLLTPYPHPTRVVYSHGFVLSSSCHPVMFVHSHGRTTRVTLIMFPLSWSSPLLFPISLPPHLVPPTFLPTYPARPTVTLFVTVLLLLPKHPTQRSDHCCSSTPPNNNPLHGRSKLLPTPSSLPNLLTYPIILVVTHSPVVALLLPLIPSRSPYSHYSQPPSCLSTLLVISPWSCSHSSTPAKTTQSTVVASYSLTLLPHVSLTVLLPRPSRLLACLHTSHQLTLTCYPNLLVSSLAVLLLTLAHTLLLLSLILLPSSYTHHLHFYTLIPPHIR